jgi:hypothetical protein
MGSVILLVSLLLKIRKRSITTTVFQVRNGQHTEWITQEDWLERQTKFNKINNKGVNYYDYTTNKSTIEAIAILPFSSSTTTNEERWHSR